MAKKILILHTSVGLGHKFIAQNIGFQLSQAGFEVRVEDILEVQKGRLADISIKIHQWMNSKAPWLWSFLYHLTNKKLVSDLTLPIRLWIASRNSEKTLALINSFNPDMVISVQNVPSAVVSYLKKSGKFKGMFGIGFSDFHLHKFWLFKNADFYLANIEEQKLEMVQLGYKPENIFICGMALKPKMEINIEEVRQRLGIQPGEKVVLVGSGSLGTGFNEELVRKLSQYTDLRPIVVCGKNHREKERLQKMFPGGRVIILEFYTPMQELYAIADIFLSKPGGLSTSESLQYGLPLLLTHYLPGQEELNVTYLLDKKLVIYEKTDIVGRVKEEVKQKSFKNSLSANPNLAKIVDPELTAKSAVLAVFKQFH